MTFEFGVTISAKLTLETISDNVEFPHTYVVDLRHCSAGKARPIEEALLKRMKNMWVKYDQIPLNFDNDDMRAQNELFRTICDHRGNIVILTEQVSEAAKFCVHLNIPFNSGEMFLVETGKGMIPVAFPCENTAQSELRSLAG